MSYKIFKITEDLDDTIYRDIYLYDDLYFYYLTYIGQSRSIKIYCLHVVSYKYTTLYDIQHSEELQITYNNNKSLYAFLNTTYENIKDNYTVRGNYYSLETVTSIFNEMVRTVRRGTKIDRLLK